MNTLNETKLSLLKKYIYEVILFVLGACVATLFFKYDDLQIFIRNRSLQESVDNRRSLDQSTDAIRENTRALNRINYFLDNLNTQNKKPNEQN